MKVALINPPVRSSKEKQYSRMGEPRLAVAYLAAYLESKDLAPIVMDAKFAGLSCEQVVAGLRSERPDLIGLTAFTGDLDDAAYLAAWAKKELPGARVVVGGPHATALPRLTMEEFPVFDFLVYGEGEITLHQLVLALQGKQPMDEIPGLVFRVDGDIRVNSPRSFIANLDEMPYPAWHLFPRSSQYPIEASRGCPFRCKFCCRITGNKIRLRSPLNVVDEMEMVLRRYRPRRFSFHDETFGVNRRHTYELLDLMVKRGIGSKVKWNVTTRADVVDMEFLKRLKEAGCTSIGLGIESGNQKILDGIGKGTTLEKIEQAVVMAKKANLHTNSFFILGHPYETRQTIQDTIDFAVRLNTTRVNFGIMVPFPGTEIAAMAERGEGNYRLLSRRWSDYGKQIGDALELTNLSRAQLERWQLSAYLQFYIHRPSLSKMARLTKEVGLKAVMSYAFRLTSRAFGKLLKSPKRQMGNTSG
ncbi:MAG: B12-binding domain-containing radical SAM protein [Chloroflexi bacterium]|nr:B12-binding domain-containing radical SAM protein [Chloroflexota bacterium]